MARITTVIFWTRLVPFVMATAGTLLHAGDPPTSSGDKIVPVTIGGRTIPIRVKERSDPLAHASFPDELDPDRVLSATNPMANKTFSLSTGALSGKDADFKNGGQETFITKAYSDPALSPSAPNLAAKAAVSRIDAASQTATGFEQSYPTSSADLGPNRADAFAASRISSEQNRTAVLGGSEKSLVFASNVDANKQYLGPGAQRVPEDIAIKDNIILSRMSGLPNRPLSIDEVRNLINHDAKPNTAAKLEAPSKALDDPNYKPEPLRDDPSPGRDDDQNDPVPAPGTMAAPPPENSEPLPQP